MNPQWHADQVKNKFCFHGVTPNREMETKANLKLARLRALGPPGATIQGSLEMKGKGFLARVTLQSAFRAFSSQAIGIDAGATVDSALERLEDQLYRWRFGSGAGGTGPRQNELGVRLPWARTS